jgi:murein DD-endopeptidase MepM/ murein hydrolase activator NlpD
LNFQNIWISLQGILSSYRLQLLWVIVALLVLGASGAVALATAVAQLDAKSLTPVVREVRERLDPPDLASQITALENHALHLYRSDVTRSSDTAESLLRRLGVFDPAAAAFLRADPLFQKLVLGRANRLLNLETNDQQTVLKLTARWSSESDGRFNRLTISRSDSGFSSALDAPDLKPASRLASGVIRSSLFAATDESGIPDAVAVQIAEIFSGDIDFHRALRKGDRFTVEYETFEADGEVIRSGRVLNVEFVNAGKTYQAMWFKDPDPAAAPAHGGYYTLDGQSLRRAYLASPLKFSRVTSGFKLRFHPILQQWRAHLGVDYGAPVGTPVHAVGNGVVAFAGVQNGFGNVVFIKHAQQHTTVYAHLSRILVKTGQNINQGQTIGAVGATGWVTGPHLHFEFRVGGVHKDPLTLARQIETSPVRPSARALFQQQAEDVRQQLARAAPMQPANAQ